MLLILFLLWPFIFWLEIFPQFHPTITFVSFFCQSQSSVSCFVIGQFSLFHRLWLADGWSFFPYKYWTEIHFFIILYWRRQLICCWNRYARLFIDSGALNAVITTCWLSILLRSVSLARSFLVVDLRKILCQKFRKKY